MQFDMNTVWSRAVELIRDNFQLLLVIAAVFLMLPTVALYLFTPDFASIVDPTSDPEVLAAQLGTMIGPIFLGFFFALLVQFAGYSAMVALMGDHRPTVGQALSAGIKSVPSLLVVTVLFALAYVIGAMLILVPISLIAGVAGAPALAFVGFLPVLIYIVWLMARMSLTMPAMVLGGTLNPFGAIASSVKLTGKNQWAIMLFWFVIVAVTGVINLLISMVFGLFVALLGSGTIAMLILGLVNGVTGMAVGMLMCAIAVAMYAQLSGPSTAAIEETFD